MSDTKKITVYTKGSGKNEDNRNGWAYILEYDTPKENDIVGTDAFHMEMSAVLSALIAIKDKSTSVEIRTNNKTIVDLYNGKNKINRSADLFDELREEVKLFTEANGEVTLTHVPKEQKDEFLEEAKKLARNEE